MSENTFLSNFSSFFPPLLTTPPLVLRLESAKAVLTITPITTCNYPCTNRACNTSRGCTTSTRTTSGMWLRSWQAHVRTVASQPRSPFTSPSPPYLPTFMSPHLLSLHTSTKHGHCLWVHPLLRHHLQYHQIRLLQCCRNRLRWWRQLQPQHRLTSRYVASAVLSSTVAMETTAMRWVCWT